MPQQHRNSRKANKVLLVWHFHLVVLILFNFDVNSYMCFTKVFFLLLLIPATKYFMFCTLFSFVIPKTKIVFIFCCCCYIFFSCCCFIIYGASTNFWKCCSSVVAAYNLLDCILLYPPTNSVWFHVSTFKHSFHNIKTFFKQIYVFVYVKVWMGRFISGTKHLADVRVHIYPDNTINSNEILNFFRILRNDVLFLTIYYNK